MAPPRSAKTRQLPVLSVVIPTRDRAGVIWRAIESVLRSPRADIEVVVVDDGSSDNTAHRLARVADSRFRYQRLESEGNANRARNVGARLSRAPLIAFLDSDDAFRPQRVDRLIDFFSRWREADCLVDGYVEFARGLTHTHRMPEVTPDRQTIWHMLLAHLIPLTNSAITTRRDAFEAVGGYDESMPRHQDRELLLRLVRTHSIFFGDQTDVEKHRAQRSISHQLDGYVAGLDALAARIPDYHAPENAELFRYLIVRGMVKALATGHWPAAWREYRQWRQAEHLPKDYLRSLAAYRVGRRQRAKAQVSG